MRTENVRTQLRIPAELYERIRERAHEERQSRNSFMCELMEKGLKADKKKAA
jgi:predicted DNA-binding protein